ncbi:hypothetical protein JOE68_000638 [Saccharothrix algeriensis]|uniref:Uncharacterized protein n=1 Tax=Saccharothrix algeriensis TaxID=173560 RepID=A0ABS2S0L7_9PSEU|nr:hypothetical protein [Saccharothrix algeriensis]
MKPVTGTSPPASTGRDTVIRHGEEVFVNRPNGFPRRNAEPRRA